MDGSVVLRFTHSGGNTDFYEDEVENLIVADRQRVVRRKNKKNYWLQVLYGNTHKEIDLKIYISGDNVSDRVDDIYDLVDSYGHPEIMRMFYEYDLDSDTEIWVQLIRQGRIRKFFAGESEVMVLPLTFIEVQPAPTPAVHRKRVGV